MPSFASGSKKSYLLLHTTLKAPKIAFVIEFWGKTGQLNMWTFGLSSGQIQKWMPPSNSASEKTHKTCVTWHYTNTAFGLGDLIWPDLDLYLLPIRSVLICCIFHPLGSLLAKFGLVAVISPISAADKVKSSDFDLWPTTSDQPNNWTFKKFLNIAQKVHISGFRLPLRYGHPFAS